jgi:hypothetical protein
MADLPQRTAGETGHIVDHNAIATWLNTQGYNEGQDVLNHSGFPGGSTNFLRADGTWASPGGASGSPGFTTAFGWQFVRASGGSDANDGASPATAKATIAAAHTALPTNGGTIWLSEGTHIISSQVNITKRGVRLIGVGRNGTVLKCGATGIHMIHWTGWDGYMTGFTITDGSADTYTPMIGRGLSGIWLENCDETLIFDVRWDGFGIGSTAGTSFDAAPAGLRVLTPNGFADWLHFYKCDFRSCYRGCALSSGNNGYFDGCNWWGAGIDRVYGEKRTSPGGNDCEFHFNQCTFAGSGSTTRYAVYITTTDASATRIGWTFDNIIMEISTATDAAGGFWVDGRECTFDNVMVSSGSVPYVHATSRATDVRWGRYGGLQPRLEQASGGSIRSWIPTDDSGTLASGHVVAV